MIEPITQDELEYIAEANGITTDEVYAQQSTNRLLWKVANLQDDLRSRAIGTNDTLFEDLADVIELLVRDKAISHWGEAKE